MNALVWNYGDQNASWREVNESNISFDKRDITFSESNTSDYFESFNEFNYLFIFLFFLILIKISYVAFYF